MTEEEFLRNFPVGVSIPPVLRELLTFQNKELEWYSGYFRLDKWAFGAPHWFGDRKAAEQFVVFGCGPDGSLYALWMYPSRTVENAPVVFLGSEGTDCGLIAGDLQQFLSLLAVGAGELGFEISWAEVSEQNPPAKRLQEFRDWLRTSFDITKSENPLSLVAAARAEHPDFAAWLANWRASRT
jgi:hypothetical protein